MNVNADHYARLAAETLAERGKEYGDYRTLFKIMAERFSRGKDKPITDLENAL